MSRVDWHVTWPRGTPRLFLGGCRSGLGNRVRGLVSFMRLAGMMPGRVAAVDWPLDGYHLHCPLGLLFTNPFLTLTPAVLARTGRVDLHHLGGRPNYVDVRSEADAVWVVEENFYWAAGDRGVMWGQFGPDRMANHALRDELLAQFDRLRPHPHVLARVETMWASLGGGPVVGVHVRRGDNAWANAHVPDDLFPPAVAAALDRSPADARLLVCSDSPGAEALLRARFGGRVFCPPRRAVDRGYFAEAAQDALAEMLLLARTSVLVRTPSSTFSQCAAWFGRVPTVEVGPTEHDW